MWQEDKWIQLWDMDAIALIRAGERTPGVSLKKEDYKIVINRHDLHYLVEFLESNGYLKPRLDERLRTEDLKITHRLLDILELQEKNNAP